MRTIVVGFVCAVAIAGCGSSGQSVGTIDFGTMYDSSTFAMLDAQNTFAAGDQFAWVAHLPGGAGATSVTLSISKDDGNGVEESVWRTSVAVANPADDALANTVPVTDIESLGATAPGSYIMRYFRGSTELAEGKFKISG